MAEFITVDERKAAKVAAIKKGVEELERSCRPTHASMVDGSSCSARRRAVIFGSTAMSTFWSTFRLRRKLRPGPTPRINACALACPPTFSAPGWSQIVCASARSAKAVSADEGRAVVLGAVQPAATRAARA
jgi:hypothetical protein